MLNLTDFLIPMHRIVFFISERDFGLGRLLVEQAISFSQIKDSNFHFITGSTEKEKGLFDQLNDAKVPYTKIEGLEYHSGFGRLAKTLNQSFQKLKPSIVHVQTNWQLALVIWVKLRYNLRFKIIYTVHGFRNTSFIGSLIFRLIIGIVFFLFVSKVVVCSSYVKDKFKFLGSKVILLYLGISKVYFEKKSNEDLNIQGTIKLFFPAVFRSGKNHEDLIGAFSDYLKNHSLPSDIKLILPGAGQRLEKCKWLVEKLNVSQYVDFPGFLDEQSLLDLTKESSIAVIPSKSETFGLCIAEPFVYGRCVVTRPVGIAVDIIKDHSNGYFFNNRQELYSILEKLLEKRELIKKAGDNAFNDRMALNWVQIGERYMNMIKQELK